MTKTYTESDIEVLTDQEHVRRRVNVYLGSNDPTTYRVPSFLDGQFSVGEFTFRPAVYKASGEIIDNSIDELTQFPQSESKLVIEADPAKGFYVVRDNGRGVPIGMHASGKHTPEVVFGSLRSGRNFKDDSKQAGVIGVNGVGSSCTNACSTRFDICIQRDGKKYTQTFTNGNTVVSKPKIVSSASKNTGTEVEFTLDPIVFKDVTIDPLMMHNRAIEIAFNNPGFDVSYNGHKYKYKKGFEDILSKLSSKFFKFTTDGMTFYAVFDMSDSSEEQFFSWVNSSYLFEGGICNTQFMNAFIDQTMKHLSPQAKKQKCEVSKSDVLPKLTVFGIMKLNDATYDSQAKTRLTGPNKRREIGAMIESQWGAFSKKHKDWLDEVLARAYSRYHQKSNLDAQKDHEKRLKGKKIPGLLDATTKDRQKAMLFVVEGLSAASSLVEVRNTETMGSYPLGGKINNTYGCSVAQVLKMGKLQDLLAAIGLTPGKPAIRSAMNFGKIIIATDADPDGSAIFTMLVSMFNQFWPELLDPANPAVFRLVVPNVVAVKGNTRLHYANRSDFEADSKRVKGYKIEYMKGLGSMTREDWERVVSSDDFMIPAVRDANTNDVFKLLFSDEASARQAWLSGGQLLEEDE